MLNLVFAIYSRIVYFICVHYGFAEHYFTISFNPSRISLQTRWL